MIGRTEHIPPESRGRGRRQTAEARPALLHHAGAVQARHAEAWIPPPRHGCVTNGPVSLDTYDAKSFAIDRPVVYVGSRNMNLRPGNNRLPLLSKHGRVRWYETDDASTTLPLEEYH
jgi:hypothetical protein